MLLKVVPAAKLLTLVRRAALVGNTRLSPALGATLLLQFAAVVQLLSAPAPAQSLVTPVIRGVWLPLAMAPNPSSRVKLPTVRWPGSAWPTVPTMVNCALLPAPPPPATRCQGMSSWANVDAAGHSRKARTTNAGPVPKSEGRI